MEHYGKNLRNTLGKPMENYGKTVGTPMENNGTTYGKLWKYEELLKTDGNTTGKRGKHMETSGKQWDNYGNHLEIYEQKLWGKTLRSYGKMTLL